MLPVQIRVGESAKFYVTGNRVASGLGVIILIAFVEGYKKYGSNASTCD